MEECEFCGKRVKKTGATSMTGCYCRHCFELVISECEDAIASITGKPYQRKDYQKRKLKEAEHEKALKDLFEGIK